MTFPNIRKNHPTDAELDELPRDEDHIHAAYRQGRAIGLTHGDLLHWAGEGVLGFYVELRSKGVTRIKALDMIKKPPAIDAVSLVPVFTSSDTFQADWIRAAAEGAPRPSFRRTLAMV